MHPPQRRKHRYGWYALALLVIGAAAFGWMVLDSLGPMATKFVSPSGRLVFMVEEGCLGHACSHQAFIATASLFSGERQRCSLSMHGDQIAFVDGVVTWWPDESGLEWHSPTYNLGGTISFARDCSAQE